MAEKIDYHVINKMQPKDGNNLTALEEQFCFLYTSDKTMGGDPIEVIKKINYHPSINEDTGMAVLASVANDVMKKETVKKRIIHFLEGREGQFVYDKTFILKEFKRLYQECMGDNMSDIAKETSDFEPDLKTAKGVLDSMAKTLGMLQNVEVKQETVDDPQAKLKSATERGKEYREKRAKLHKLGDNGKTKTG